MTRAYACGHEPHHVRSPIAARFCSGFVRVLSGFCPGSAPIPPRYRPSFGPPRHPYIFTTTHYIYIKSRAPQARRGLANPYAAEVTVLQQTLSTEELKAWGWRIPFVIGAAAAVISLYLRKSLDETSTSESRHKRDAGTIRGVWQHKGAFLTVVGFTAGGSLIFYTFTTYMQKYLVNTAGMHAKTASSVMTCALFVYMLMQPVFGALSDKIGRRTSMILFGSFAVIGTVPLMHALKDVSSPVAAFALITIALAIVSFYTSISGLIKAEMFPPEVRAMGVGLSYAVANAIFGGSAEYVALWFKSIDSETTFYWYVTVICAISLIVSYRMRDPSKEGYLRHEP